MSKKKLVKEEPMDWWYSRLVAMEEKDYQVVVNLLEIAAKKDPKNKEVANTIITFKKGQEEHYVSREEYIKRRESDKK